MDKKVGGKKEKEDTKKWATYIWPALTHFGSNHVRAFLTDVLIIRKIRIIDSISLNNKITMINAQQQLGWTRAPEFIT